MVVRASEGAFSAVNALLGWWNVRLTHDVLCLRREANKNKKEKKE